MKPLITCVVAVYNVEKYLDECIDSLIKQEYENVEIILVDDGSTDSSGNICDEFQKKNKKITVYHQENQGANSARNLGLEKATGEWIYFVDGDDFVNKNVFSAIEKYLNSENNIVLFTNYIYLNGKVIRKGKKTEEPILFSKKDFDELSLSAMNRLGDSCYNYRILDSVSIWNKIYNISFLRENDIAFVPGFPKTQDLSFNLLVYEKACKGVFLDNEGYFYRINPDSVSNRFQKDFPRKLQTLHEWYYRYYIAHNNDRMKEAYYGRILTFMRTMVVLYSCNRNNKAKYTDRKTEFCDIVKKYKIDELELRSIRKLPIKERLLSFFIIKKWFFACELLSKGYALLTKK